MYRIKGILNSRKSLKDLLKNSFSNNSNVQHAAKYYCSKVVTKIQDISNQKNNNSINLVEGLELEGFQVTKIAHVPEFNLKAISLIHNRSQAQYLHLERDDDNNTFSVGFRTTPYDSSGLTHILEHLSICGSDRFPCRDPYFKMLTRSMSTFMNAMTWPDFTMYPFSTQNPQDFHNLLNVYVDAVFNPLLREMDFRQEGWRLEHTDVAESNSPIIFKGVVFNEMKGVFSDNQSLFGQKLLNILLPGHTYGFISGGDPLVIPKLSYEDLKNYHNKYYSPSNARFYSYGNFPLVSTLKFLNENYLESKKAASLDTSVPLEKRWDKPRKAHIKCRPDPLAPDPTKQSTLAFGYLCSDILDIQETFHLQVLSDLLIKGPNAPFYKSLVESNIGSGLLPSSGFDAVTRDTFFAIGLQGIKVEDFEKVTQIIEDTLDKVSKEGFPQEQIESILHSLELSIKHQTSNFGLTLLFGLAPLWNHDGDLIKALQMSQQMETLKDHLKKNPSFLQDLTKKYFITNPHKLILTMSPDAEFENYLMSKEEELLKEKLEKLNDSEKKVIFKLGQDLQKEQQKKDDVSVLPTLYLKDISRKLPPTTLQDISLEGITIQVSPQPTNGVNYFRAVFGEIENLPQNLHALIPIFGNVATKMGTAENDYREFDQKSTLYTGGIQISNLIAESNTALDHCEEAIITGSHCLHKNTDKMFELFSELSQKPCDWNLDRFSTLVRVEAAEAGNSLVQSGHLYAMSAAASLVSPVSSIKDRWNGMSYIQKLLELARQPQMDTTLENVREIAQRIFFNRAPVRCSINCQPDHQENSLNELKSFLKGFPKTQNRTRLVSKKGEISQKTQGVHYILPLGVNYAAKSIAGVPYSHKDFAPLQVMAKLLSLKFLHVEIREKGGAYGSGLSVTSSGLLNFFSYRDPNAMKTLDTFDRCSEWIKSNAFEKREIEESIMGIFKTIDAPIPPGSRGMDRFFYDRDDAAIEKHRLALFNVSEEDVKRVAETYLSRTGSRALIGPENNDLNKRTNENWTQQKMDM